MPSLLQGTDKRLEKEKMVFYRVILILKLSTIDCDTQKHAG